MSYANRAAGGGQEQPFVYRDRSEHNEVDGVNVNALAPPPPPPPTDHQSMSVDNAPAQPPPFIPVAQVDIGDGSRLRHAGGQHSYSSGRACKTRKTVASTVAAPTQCAAAPGPQSAVRSVSVAAAAHCVMVTHANCIEAEEVTGLLIGYYAADIGRVDVLEAMPMVRVDKRRDRVEIEPADTERASRRANALGGGAKVVGWYHSHPDGFSVVPSPVDCRMQKVWEASVQHEPSTPWVGIIVAPAPAAAAVGGGGHSCFETHVIAFVGDSAKEDTDAALAELQYVSDGEMNKRLASSEMQAKTDYRLVPVRLRRGDGGDEHRAHVADGMRMIAAGVFEENARMFDTVRRDWHQSNMKWDDTAAEQSSVYATLMMRYERMVHRPLLQQVRQHFAHGQSQCK